MSKSRLEIQEYSLYDFMLKFQCAVQEGYVLGDAMGDVPQMFGTVFYAGLTRVEVAEDKPAKQRKPKE